MVSTSNPLQNKYLIILNDSILFHSLNLNFKKNILTSMREYYLSIIILTSSKQTYDTDLYFLLGGSEMTLSKKVPYLY